MSGVPGIVEGYTHILLCDLVSTLGQKSTVIGSWTGYLVTRLYKLITPQIYFPHLYPLLLQTLLEVTEPRPDDGSALAPTAGSLTDCGNRDDKDEEVFGPIIIMSCKCRPASLSSVTTFPQSLIY